MKNHSADPSQPKAENRGTGIRALVHSVCCLLLLAFGVYWTFGALTPPDLHIGLSGESIVSLLLGASTLLICAYRCLAKRRFSLRFTKLFFVPPAICILLAGVASLRPVLQLESAIADGLKTGFVDLLFDKLTDGLAGQSAALLWAALSFMGLVFMSAVGQAGKEVGAQSERPRLRITHIVAVTGFIAALDILFIRFGNGAHLSWMLCGCPNARSGLLGSTFHDLSLHYHLFFFSVLFCLAMPVAMAPLLERVQRRNTTERPELFEACTLMIVAFVSAAVTLGTCLSVTVANSLLFIKHAMKIDFDTSCTDYSISASSSAWTARYAPYGLAAFGLIVAGIFLFYAPKARKRFILPAVLLVATFTAASSLGWISHRHLSTVLDPQVENCPLARSVLRLTNRDVTFTKDDFSVEVVGISQSDDLVLPRVVPTEDIKDVIVVAVSKRSIIVNDSKVADLRDRKVDERFTGAPRHLVVLPLRDALQQISEHLEMMAARTGMKKHDEILLAMDRDTPAELMRKVVYTARAAGFRNLYFAVDATDSQHLCEQIGMVRSPRLTFLFDESNNSKNVQEMIQAGGLP